AVPRITSITPPSGAAGTNLSTTILGTNLNRATSVTFSGTGVTATIGSGDTSTSLPITITVGNDAAATLRTVTVATPLGPSSPFTGFTVLPLGTPIVNDLSANPPGLSQAVAPYYGGPFTLTING